MLIFPVLPLITVWFSVSSVKLTLFLVIFLGLKALRNLKDHRRVINNIFACFNSMDNSVGIDCCILYVYVRAASPAPRAFSVSFFNFFAAHVSVSSTEWCGRISLARYSLPMTTKSNGPGDCAA